MGFRSQSHCGRLWGSGTAANTAEYLRKRERETGNGNRQPERGATVPKIRSRSEFVCVPFDNTTGKQKPAKSKEAAGKGADYQTTNRQKSGSCSSNGDSLKANLAKSTTTPTIPAITTRAKAATTQCTRAKQIQIKLNNKNSGGRKYYTVWSARLNSIYLQHMFMSIRNNVSLSI